jgi:hypothetical protein
VNDEAEAAGYFKVAADHIVKIPSRINNMLSLMKRFHRTEGDIEPVREFLSGRSGGRRAGWQAWHRSPV